MRPLNTKYKQSFIYVLLLVVAVAAMGLIRRCNSGDALPPLARGNSAGDTIDVAVIYGPLSYYLYADTLGGVNFDMLSAFGKQTGRPVKMWPVVTLNDALDKLDDGTFDMLASLPSDNSVKERFLTTQSVFLDRLVLVQLADTAGNVKINSALDLANDTVHIQTDSPAHARLSNLANEIGAPINVVTENDLSEEYLCMKVATGDIFYAVVNEKTAAALKRKYTRLSYDNPVSFTQFQVWLLNKNDTSLLRTADSWLHDFKESKQYQEIMNKYQSPTQKANQSPEY